MICTSIQNQNKYGIFDILDISWKKDLVAKQSNEYKRAHKGAHRVEMAEIRLDKCRLPKKDLDELINTTLIPLIATCRGGNKAAFNKLKEAIEFDVDYVDLELEAPAAMSKDILNLCRERGVSLIRSYHNYDCTPSEEELENIYRKALAYGANIVKIVTTAQSDEDWQRLKKLYSKALPGTLVAFCMGEKASYSRIECLALGAPFTYASAIGGEPTAPGQMNSREMAEKVYGDFIFPEYRTPPIPSSKSFAQRAIVAAALADGMSVLCRYTHCDDSDAALEFAKTLGAKVREIDGNLGITGIAATTGAMLPKEFNTGESGLLTRLVTPLSAALCKSGSTISGEGTLLSRPLSDAKSIMASFGVCLNSERQAPRKQDCMVPLTVSGKLLPGKADIDGKGGSQLISGLMMALPLCSDNSTLYVHNPKSIPYMFMTSDVLKKFGVKITSEMEGGEEFLDTQDWSLCTAVNFHIKGHQKYTAADFILESDWSAAAPFLVAGAIFGSADITEMDMNSLQADIGIMDILSNAGVSLPIQEFEDCVAISSYRTPLTAFTADLNNSPDLFPIVSVLAAFCPGDSRLIGVSRLVHKETNRAAAISEMLTKMGVEVSVSGDTMCIRGESLTSRILNGRLLKGGKYTSHGDHRMVMALKVAAMGASSKVEIDDEKCVSKSFPGFNEMI